MFVFSFAKNLQRKTFQLKVNSSPATKFKDKSRNIEINKYEMKTFMFKYY